MFTKKLALFLAAVMAMASLSLPAFAYDSLFSDVPEEAWEAPFVYDLVDRGILSGYGDGTFGPRITVKRCEYAKMLVSITNTPISTSVSTPYVDVPGWEWYFPYVNSSLSYITGFTTDSVLYFQPEWDATREDVTVALVKALGIDLAPYGDPTGFLSERFSDTDSISAHNRVYIAAAVDKGYITGNTDGTFRGQDSIIRAEIVAILCRAFPAGDDELTASNETPAVNAALTAFFLDVGQGDACFLELPGGKTMLIDAGTAGAAGPILSLVRGRGHSRLDYVVATHPHADHIGGMAEILSSCSVGTLYMPYAKTNTKTYEQLLMTILEKEVPVVTAAAGTAIEGIPGVTAVFAAPAEGAAEDLNNASAVLRLSFGETDFLFAGDAEAASENRMLASGMPLDAEVLKAGHHGSDTSTSPAFLAAVRPAFAVISCGAGNSYGHPSAAVLEALAGAGAAVCRTDTNGTITISTDGRTITCLPERE